MAQTTVKIKVVGGSETLAAVQGVRKETNAAAAAEKKALAETARAAKLAEQEKIKAARSATAAEKKAAAEAAKLAEKQAQQASRQSERWAKLSQKSADYRMRAEEKVTRNAIKEGEKQTRAAQREAEKQRKEADRLAEHWARLAQKSADQRMRAEERVTQHAAREAVKAAKLAERTRASREQSTRRIIRGAGGLVGAAVGGAMAGGAVAANTARGITGTDDVATRVQKANDFRERLVLVSGQAGLSDAGTAEVQSQITSASMASGKGPDELVGVLEAGQSKFNDLKFFADNLEEIAKMAKSTGSDTGELATAIGYVKQAFGLTGKEAIEAGYKMIQAAREGSIEVKDFARDFASVAGVFAQSTGQKGMAGVNEFLGVSQSAGTLGAGSAETATMVERLVAFMGTPTHQKELRERTGVDVRGMKMSEIVATLADNKKFNKEGVRAEVFGGDIIPNKAIMALIASYRRVQSGTAGALDIGTIGAVSAAEGKQYTATMMGRLEKTGALDMQRQAIEMQLDTIKNLKDYNEQILAVSKASNALEKSFGTLSLWASAIGGAGAVAGGIGLASKLAGAGAGAAATGGTIATLASTGAIGAGTASALTAVAAGAAATGAALIGGAIGGGLGYGANKLGELASGGDESASELLQNFLYDTFGPYGDVAQATLTPPVEGAIEVKVHVQNDGQVNATTAVTKSRGARISTGSGPNMAGAL
jgi:hypothetical protein